MNSNTLIRNMAIAASLAIAIPLFAKPVTKDLPITHTLKVGKVDVRAGDYRVMIDNNHLTLMNGKKVVAESSGRWENRDEKAPATEIVSNADGQVLELRFGGKASVFVLSE